MEGAAAAAAKKAAANAAAAEAATAEAPVATWAAWAASGVWAAAWADRMHT